MKETKNILLCGVGGQGILLASEIISTALMHAGFDVKQSEVHGMAQRGGSVVSHIRFGRKVYSPLIEPGGADFAVSFELMEALRYLPFLNPKSSVVINTRRILPAPVATGADTYPEDVLEQLKSRKLVIYPLDAYELARAAGETLAGNLVLVGALSSLLPVDEEIFTDVITAGVPSRFLDANLKAFAAGREKIKTGVRRAVG